jgi:hypothetical protein
VSFIFKIEEPSKDASSLSKVQVFLLENVMGIPGKNGTIRIL